MPTDAHLRPRRNARSFDLDDSAAKAAAWVWHLHTSNPGITTEGRFISSHSRRRSSGSYDRKASRFQQEVSTTTNAVAGGNKTETPVWDCGSNLYDTFELVAFGNRLDRSLMEVVPITPPQAHPQEHHMKSPLHAPNGILRTLSLPRSFSRQTSKNPTAISIPNPEDMSKLSKSYNNGTRAGSGQKASTKWSRMAKFMNVIKKVVVLHKQVSFMGCKRSTNVIESSQRPLDPMSMKKDNESTRGAKLSTRNSRSSESMDDELSIQNIKARSNSDSMSNYKLSIPSKDKSNYESNIGDKASMQKKAMAYNSERPGDGLSTNNKIRCNSESMSDGLLVQKKIRSRRKCARNELVCMDNRIKGSNLEGVYVKESINGINLEGVNVEGRTKDASEYLDLHKHLHHHHHHHHHHHYLHHSESARLSPETMSLLCAEQS